VHRVAIAERAVSRARFEHNPEVSSQLEQLYLYVEGTLARATIERSVEPLRDARAVLERLADAWNHAGISAGETE
jgi:flagellin-specific chaperone FliS